MSHWAERYVGLSYVPGEFDCASLAQKVLREQYGHEMALPSCARAVHHQVRMLDELRDEIAPRIDEPLEGDLVLMRCGGRLSHCGVLVIIGGCRHVLHAMRNAGQVVLHRLGDLERFDCRIVSYHRPKGMHT